MSQSVRDLLDGAQPSAVKTTAMRWLAPDSQAPCPAVHAVGGRIARCAAVGRHDQHQPQEDR